MATRRRGAGEGTIGRLKDGRWCARVTTGYKDGKQQRKPIYGKTRAEVAGKLAAVLRDMQRGIGPGDDRQTVAQFLRDWLRIKASSLRPNTLVGYEVSARRHLVPRIGSIHLTKLSPQHVQSMFAAMLRDGVNPPTVVGTRRALRAALNDAIRWQLIPRNAAALTTPPTSTRHEIVPLTVAETRAFFSSMQGDRNEALFVSASLLGLRKGELLGLRWADVDLNKGAISVRIQAQRVGGMKQLVPLKTAKSRRTVAIPGLVSEALRAHRERQEQERLLAGDRWHDLGLVFPTTIGTIGEPSRITRMLHEAIERAGLPHQRFHDLRHLAASLMLAQAVQPKMMQEVLGHSRIGTTLDLYSHLMPDALREVAQRIDELFVNPDRALGGSTGDKAST